MVVHRPFSRLVREHLRTFYAAVEHGFEGASLPDFVRADLEGYVRCGVLSRGFAHLQCEGLRLAVPLCRWLLSEPQEARTTVSSGA